MMTPDQLFVVLNDLALLSWIALAALPRVRWVAHALTAVWIPVVLATISCHCRHRVLVK